MEVPLDTDKLLELARYKMPYGKFKGHFLVDLPEPYLAWFRQKGFPAGKLGQMLHAMYEIKCNGLDGLIRKIQKEFPGK